MVVPNKHGGGVRSKFNGANFLGLLYSKILKMANFFKNIKYLIMLGTCTKNKSYQKFM